MIQVYTNTGCGACLTVKKILESQDLVEDEDFKYINIDENEEVKEHVMSMYMGVPVTEYDGKSILGVEFEDLNEMIGEYKNDIAL